MADQNPHLTTLKIMRDILDSPVSSEALSDRYGVSDRTLKRYLSDLRHMGAELETRLEGRQHLWYCANSKQIESAAILERWLEIEQKRCLLPSAN